jgi:hypothetical protein
MANVTDGNQDACAIFSLNDYTVYYNLNDRVRPSRVTWEKTVSLLTGISAIPDHFCHTADNDSSPTTLSERFQLVLFGWVFQMTKRHRPLFRFSSL